MNIWLNKNNFRRRIKTRHLFGEHLFKKKSYVNKSDLFQGQANGISVKRVDHRPFYDSRWEIVTPDLTVTVIRADDETADCLLKELLKVPILTKDFVNSLDEKSTIYYD